MPAPATERPRLVSVLGRVLWTIVAAVVLVIGLALFVRAVEPRLAFYPLAGETETPREYGVRYEPVTIETRDGERLHAWLLHADAPRAQIVYFHGNGGNLSVWAPILAGVTQRGYLVLAVDYRGYGLSTGSPTERGLYRDVDAVLEYVSGSRDQRMPLVYWGRSLGTTMAAYAASKSPPDGLVLEAAFSDARSLVRSSPPLALLALFSTYRFPTAEWLRNVRCPVLVLHGEADSVIPFALGRALYEKIVGAKQFVAIRGGEHNDLAPRDARVYWDAVDRFIAALRRSVT